MRRTSPSSSALFDFELRKGCSLAPAHQLNEWQPKAGDGRCFDFFDDQCPMCGNFIGRWYGGWTHATTRMVEKLPAAGPKKSLNSTFDLVNNWPSCCRMAAARHWASRPTQSDNKLVIAVIWCWNMTAVDGWQLSKNSQINDSQHFHQRPWRICLIAIQSKCVVVVRTHPSATWRYKEAIRWQTTEATKVVTKRRQVQRGRCKEAGQESARTRTDWDNFDVFLFFYFYIKPTALVLEITKCHWSRAVYSRVWTGPHCQLSNGIDLGRRRRL